MLSFGVTPFTDLPAHRIFRSYFRNGTDDNEKRSFIDSGLSHLWSEERRHEENRFAILMTDLTAIAKELGVVVSGTSGSTLGAPIIEFKPYGRVEIALRVENERIYSHMVKQARASPPVLHTSKDSYAECPMGRRWMSLDDQHQDHWLNGINAKVQTLLQEAHNVLESAVNPSSTAEECTESGGDMHNGENSNNGDGDNHDHPFDMVSLYMRDEASFSFEGPTFVEDNEDSGNDKGIASSKSGGDWVSGLGDVSMDTLNTSFSQDYRLDNLLDNGKLDESMYDDFPMNALAYKQSRVWSDYI